MIKRIIAVGFVATAFVGLSACNVPQTDTHHTVHHVHVYHHTTRSTHH